MMNMVKRFLNAVSEEHGENRKDAALVGDWSLFFGVVSAVLMVCLWHSLSGVMQFWVSAVLASLAVLLLFIAGASFHTWWRLRPKK